MPKGAADAPFLDGVDATASLKTPGRAWRRGSSGSNRHMPKVLEGGLRIPWPPQWPGRAASGQSSELPGLGFGVARSPEGFAHQDLIQKFEGGFQGHFEGVQVAVVDPQDGWACAQGRVKFCPGMDLHDGIQSNISRRRDKIRQTRVVQERGDEQDRGFAKAAGLQDLVALQREILAQHGQRDGSRYGAQVGVVAQEEFRLREHGDPRGSSSEVFAGQAQGVVILDHHPFGGRCFLALGEHADGLPCLAPEVLLEYVAGDGSQERHLLELVFREVRVAGGDLWVVGGRHPLEDSPHGGRSREVATSVSRAESALPESMDVSAKRAPADRLGASPATTKAAAALNTTMSRLGPFS